MGSDSWPGRQPLRYYRTSSGVNKRQRLPVSPLLSFGLRWAETVPPQGFTLIPHTGNRAREKGVYQTGVKTLASRNTKETATGCWTPPGVCQHPKKARAGWERAFRSGSAKRPTFCKVKAVIQLGEHTSRIEATRRITALCFVNSIAAPSHGEAAASAPRKHGLAPNIVQETRSVLIRLGLEGKIKRLIIN